MTTPIENRNFVQQISLEDYNKQKREYTEKALLELKSQMAVFKPNNPQRDSEDDSSDSSSGEPTTGVNVIIKTYKDSVKSGEKDTNTGLKRRRVPSKSIDEGADGLSNSIYVQREIDLQEIQKLKNQVKRLKSALEEEERKNHFLKLDLCNAQVDVSDLKQTLGMRDVKIKQLEAKNNENWLYIIKLKMFIFTLLVLYIASLLY
jgi:hypothetical protein